jgi:hypothetical protein
VSSQSHFKRTLAVCIGFCMVAAQLAPSVAVACEGGGSEWVSSHNVGGEAKEEKEAVCFATRVREGCEIEFRNILAAESLEIVKNEIKGAGAALWKVEAEGCKPKTRLAANGGACDDDVETRAYEANKVADHCIQFKKENGVEKLECSILQT